MEAAHHALPLGRLFDSKPSPGDTVMLPTAGLLLVFLTYPLGLGLWLSVTGHHDRSAGRVYRSGEI